jgi:hypothetical protein
VRRSQELVSTAVATRPDESVAIRDGDDLSRHFNEDHAADVRIVGAPSTLPKLGSNAE